MLERRTKIHNAIVLIGFLLYGECAIAQYDTVVYQCPSTNCNVNYSFKKPTILILQTKSHSGGKLYDDKQYFHFKDGKLNDLYYRTTNGILVDSGSYQNGFKEGLFKNWSWSDGRLISAQYYKKDKLHGECKYWEWDGRLEFIIEYSEGKKNGKMINYFDNGQKGIEKTFRNDTIKDSVYYWYSTGQKMKAEFDCTNPDGSVCKEIFYNTFEENFGIGKLNFYSRFPQGDEKTKEWKDEWQKTCEKYYLYEHPRDKKPAKWANGSYVSLVSAYNGILLMKQDGNWWQIMVRLSNSTSKIADTRKLWIKKSVFEEKFKYDGANYIFLWEKLLVGKRCSVVDKKINPVRKYPQLDSDIISCSTVIHNTLRIVEVKGEWAKVVPSCIDCIVQDPDKCFIEGWIRWRDDKQFLINRSWIFY
ncbi:MAG: toxin-antitoxin system YwqK family antitoxin [Bacteroidota bacterium]